MTETNGKDRWRRYRGDDDLDGKERVKWEKWVMNHLLSSTLGKEVLGNRVYTLLDGGALEGWGNLEPTDLHRLGGEGLIFTVLRGRFPERQVTDKVGEVMVNVFTFKPARGKMPGVMAGRFRSIMSKAKEHDMVFPPELQGFILLSTCRLSREAKGSVLAYTKGTYNIDKVAHALMSLFPDGLPPPDPTAKCFVLDSVSKFETIGKCSTAASTPRNLRTTFRSGTG